MATNVVHLRDVAPRLRVFSVWERKRNSKEVHWAMELFAEMLGVFFYVYFGVGSTAGWVVGNITKTIGLSSILQIGFAYALGILFALGVCGSTSGGHFNPCFTIAHVVFKGFPKMKAVRYIAAQILGAYIACLLVYNEWKVLIDGATEVLASTNMLEATQFTPNGPAGIFAFYLMPGQTLPRVFLAEFVNCTLIALILWSVLDLSNNFVSPAVAPITVSMAYATTIWGFAAPGASLNTARDVGGRLAAITIWGTQANGGRYAAIAALVNIPATLFAACLYEFILTDSDRVVSKDQLNYLNQISNHARLSHHSTSSNSRSGSFNEKAETSMYENANLNHA